MKTMRLLLLTLGVLATCAMSLAQEVKLIFAIEGKGEFTMSLNYKAAPKSCAQIQKLAETGFYNGQRFHRAVKTPKPFLVQVGDPASKATLDGSLLGGSGVKLPFEANDLNCDLGSVGIATQPGQKNSGDSQFFILLSQNRYLNGSYTIFAQITSGMDVVEKIAVGDKISGVRVVKG